LRNSHRYRADVAFWLVRATYADIGTTQVAPFCGGQAARISETQVIYIISIRERGRFRWNHVQGHRQLTDVYLLALAISNQGRLATFDSTISLEAIEAAKKQNLELISA